MSAGSATAVGLLDHVIVLIERHLRRLMNEYFRYNHHDRAHLALAKSTPAASKREQEFGVGRRIKSMPWLGGLHDHFDLTA
jgi:hypothetical protein